MFAGYKLIVISDEVGYLASPLSLISSSLNDIAKIRNRRSGIWHFCALTWTFMHFLALLFAHGFGFPFGRRFSIHESHGKGFLMHNSLLGFSEIIKDDADLASSEILAVGVVACGLKLLSELGNAIDPTHQVASGGARVAVGEVKERKLLFAIASYFHNAGCLIVVLTLILLMSNAEVYDFFYGTYDV